MSGAEGVMQGAPVHGNHYQWPWSLEHGCHLIPLSRHFGWASFGPRAHLTACAHGMSPGALRAFWGTSERFTKPCTSCLPPQTSTGCLLIVPHSNRNIMAGQVCFLLLRAAICLGKPRFNDHTLHRVEDGACWGWLLGQPVGTKYAWWQD